jgi:SRSO17 transposase
MCPLYVAGLIGPGDRKSVSPMAERVAPGDYDRLHHFVPDGVWDEGPLEFELAIQEAGLKTLAATIKARWVCEWAHQQIKEKRTPTPASLPRCLALGKKTSGNIVKRTFPNLDRHA